MALGVAIALGIIPLGAAAVALGITGVAVLGITLLGVVVALGIIARGVGIIGAAVLGIIGAALLGEGMHLIMAAIMLILMVLTNNLGDMQHHKPLLLRPAPPHNKPLKYSYPIAIFLEKISLKYEITF